MTVNQIVMRLTASPSYLKKGDTWLATYFNCSPRTIKRLKSELKEIKKTYINSLN